MLILFWVWLWLVLAALATLLFGSLLVGVPPLSSSRADMNRIVDLLRNEEQPSPVLIHDLGCGWGGLLLALARAFPAAQIHGIELSPLPCLVAWMRTRRKANVSLRWGNIFDLDLEGASAVTCYLMPRLMVRLERWLDRQAPTGLQLVTNGFLLREREPDAIRRSPRGAAVALYRWPARSGATAASDRRHD